MGIIDRSIYFDSIKNDGVVKSPTYFVVAILHMLEIQMKNHYALHMELLT